eukprot:m51a1_g7275 putative adp-ribosylation factor-like protein 6 (1228) ;mRNA; r:241279-255575
MGDKVIIEIILADVGLMDPQQNVLARGLQASAHWHAEDHFFTYLKWSLDIMRDMAQSVSKESIMKAGVKQAQAGKKQKKMKESTLDTKKIKATSELNVTAIESKEVLFSKFFESQNNCKKVALIASKLMTWKPEDMQKLFREISKIEGIDKIPSSALEMTTMWSLSVDNVLRFIRRAATEKLTRDQCRQLFQSIQDSYHIYSLVKDLISALDSDDKKQSSFSKTQLRVLKNAASDFELAMGPVTAAIMWGKLTKELEINAALKNMEKNSILSEKPVMVNWNELVYPAKTPNRHIHYNLVVNFLSSKARDKFTSLLKSTFLMPKSDPLELLHGSSKPTIDYTTIHNLLHFMLIAALELTGDKPMHRFDTGVGENYVPWSIVAGTVPQALCPRNIYMGTAVQLFVVPSVPWKYTRLCFALVLRPKDNTTVAQRATVRGEVSLYPVSVFSGKMIPGDRTAAAAFAKDIVYTPLAAGTNKTSNNGIFPVWLSVDVSSNSQMVAWSKGVFVGLSWSSCARVQMVGMFTPFDRRSFALRLNRIWEDATRDAWLIRTTGHNHRWYCNKTSYNNNQCDCNCGAPDPDCDGSTSTGCGAGSTCDQAGRCVELDWSKKGVCKASNYWQYDGCQCECGSVIDPDCFVDTAPASVCNSKSITYGQCNSGSIGAGSFCTDLWKCDASQYNDGMVCNCGCGLPDPDCDNTSLDTTCPGNSLCVNDKCLSPREWKCEPRWYNYKDECDCGCGTYDPDCDDENAKVLNCATGQTCNYLGVCADTECGDTVVAGNEECDGGLNCAENCTCISGFKPYSPGQLFCTGCGNMVVDRDLNESCDGGLGCDPTCSCASGYAPTTPREWKCEPRWYNYKDECDCGCGTYDPDCDDENAKVLNCATGQTCNYLGVCADTECGDTVVAGNEECDGGLNCAENCTCISGFKPYSPSQLFCTGCGNVVVDRDLNESCDGGLGCDPTCSCASGYAPTCPLSFECVAVPKESKSNSSVVISSTVGSVGGFLLLLGVAAAILYARKVKYGPRKLNIPVELDGEMSFIKSFFQKLGFAKTHFQMLVVGLDASGKTTIINWLNPTKKAGARTDTHHHSHQPPAPLGKGIEEFSKNNINFTVVDMSGAGRYRNLWEHYYSPSSAVIFVVDSSDRFRVVVAKDELDCMLAHKNMKKNVPLLVYANKMDVKEALSGPEVARLLDLDKIHDHPWHITASCALTGEGLEDGLKWLTDVLLRSK